MPWRFSSEWDCQSVIVCSKSASTISFLWAFSRANMPHLWLCCLMLHFMNSLEAMPNLKTLDLKGPAKTCKDCKGSGVALFWHWRTRRSCRLKRNHSKNIHSLIILQHSAEVLFGPNFLLLRAHHVSCLTSIVQRSRWRHVACKQLRQQRLQGTLGVAAGRTAGTAVGPAGEATRYSGPAGFWWWDRRELYSVYRCL